MKLIWTLGLALSMAVGAHARSLSEDEAAQVSAKMDELDEALESKNSDALTDGIPNQILEKMASQANMSVDELRELVKTQTDAVMEKIEISDTQYSLEGFDLIEGDAVDYGFLTLDFQYSMQNIIQNLNAPVMILHEHEGDQWWTLRVDEAQIPLLQEVYPDLADMEFPKLVPEGGTGQ